LKARANSFFILYLLPRNMFLDYMQKSGGCPLFGACGIGFYYARDFNIKPARLQGCL
jgi:hypothetical protein